MSVLQDYFDDSIILISAFMKNIDCEIVIADKPGRMKTKY